MTKTYLMNNMITFFQVKSCSKCQRFETIKTQAPVMTPIKVSSPLELVGMDLIGPLKETERGHKHVLTMTDYFSKVM